VYFGTSTLLTEAAHAIGFEGFVGVPSFAAGALAVGVISGAYQAEVFRASYLAIARGELEAAVSVGMNRAVMFRRIIAPQVLSFALPGLGNLWQVALKDSSLISVTGLAELMRVSQVGAGSTHQPSHFIRGARSILVMTLVTTRLFDRRKRGRRAECAAPRGERHGPRFRRENVHETHQRAAFDACRVVPVGRPRRAHRCGRDLDARQRSEAAGDFRPGLCRCISRHSALDPALQRSLWPRPAAVRASVFWPFLRDAFNCAVLALALCTAAYQSEIFRGALLAVPHGQIESARACGMSRPLLFRRIVFPIALRHALPAYSTEMISMVKATALVSLVTLWDVMSVALKIRNDTLVTYLPLLIAGVIYFAVNLVIGVAFLALERRLSPHLRGRPN
jgi:ABC-type arginine transport system permease subunit